MSGWWLLVALSAVPSPDDVREAVAALELERQDGWSTMVSDPVALFVDAGWPAPTTAEAARVLRGFGAREVLLFPRPTATSSIGDAFAEARTAGSEMGVLVHHDGRALTVELIDLGGGLWDDGPRTLARAHHVPSANGANGSGQTGSSTALTGALRVRDLSATGAFPPCPGRSVGSWLAAFASFEPWYRWSSSGLQPVLAGDLPRIDAHAIEIPVRTGVRDHAGRTVDGAAVARGLNALRSAGCVELALHTPGPVRVRSIERPAPTPGGLPERSQVVVVPWTGTREEAASALTDPGLRWFDPAPDAWIGTGPLEVRATGSGLEARPPSEAAGAPAETEASGVGRRARLEALRVDAASLRSGSGQAPADAYVEPAPTGAFLEAWALAVSEPLAARRPELGAWLERHLDRARLLAPFARNGFEPWALEASPDAGANAPSSTLADAPGALTLSVARSFPAEAAERLQLFLLQRGLRVVVERVRESELDARRRRGAFELILDRLVEPLVDGQPARVEARLRALYASAGPAAPGAVVVPVAQRRLTVRVDLNRRPAGPPVIDPQALGAPREPAP